MCPASPSQSAVEQIVALHARCRVAEQQQLEAKNKADALEREVQELRAKLVVVEGDAATKALWKAAAAVATGQSEVLVEMRAKEAAWLAEAHAGLEERRRTEIWRLLHERLSPAQLSDVARSVGGSALDVGRLLFDSKLRDRRQTMADQITSVSRELSAPRLTAKIPAKSQVRSLSRPSLPPKAPVLGVAQAAVPTAAGSTPVLAANVSTGASVRSSSVRDRIARLESNGQIR
jgi:hypothetical protein